MARRDYLRFDAFSIKRLIEQKLSENTDFTDHIYPGSDLSIFIDVVSYAFEILQYYINQAGSETVVEDAQFYENMNRLVKFLDYNPDGYGTSTVDLVLNGVPENLNNTVLPPYSTLTLDDLDENGNPITFSTTDYFYMYDDRTVQAGDAFNIFPAYNGSWYLYEDPLVAEGTPFETFVLDNLFSEAESKSYTAWPFVHAIIRRGNEFLTYKPVTNSLFIDPIGQRTYNSNERLFELRLDEFKRTTMKFGDGIYSEQLQQGDLIYVIYLKSNGPDGQISANAITNRTFKTEVKGLDSNILRLAIEEDYSNLVNETDLSITDSIKASNFAPSSLPYAEETVDEIRTSAPNHFRTGGKLITQNDFDFYIRNNYFRDIVDVRVMNNWEYLGSFLKWLYQSGIDYKGSRTFYLSNSLKATYGYEFADACDFNNVYAWIQMKTGFPIPKQNIIRKTTPLKALTSELVLLDPILVNFVPCAVNNGYDIKNWDPDNENYIEVKLDPATSESPQKILNRVNSILITFFTYENQRIGGTIDFDNLQSQILGIIGVIGIKTVYRNKETGRTVSTNGLKFAQWTTTILNGADLKLVNGQATLEDFMFPSALENTFINRLKVITEAAYNSNEVEY
jgi:hypothetical protein